VAPPRLVAVLCALAGAGLLALAVLRGEARVGVALIVPFVLGTGPLGAAGVLLLFAAFALAFAGGARAPAEAARPAERRSAGIVLLGPLPIVWGEPRAARWLLLLALAVVAALALALTR
jgi:uncharacterized membrane protein